MQVTDSIIYDYLMDEPLELTMTAKLTGALVKDDKGWTHDAWEITIGTPYPKTMTLTYRMGVGNRKGWNAQARTAHDVEQNEKRTRPAKPTLRDVLISVGSDYRTAAEMPRDEADAMDYLMTELGYDGGSDTLRAVRALNKAADDLRKMLAGTGIDPDHFADWCHMLDTGEA